MSKRPTKPKSPQMQTRPIIEMVDSLLDHMVDSEEYRSIVRLGPKNMDAARELQRAITEIEQIRERPLLVYAGNVINPSIRSPIEFLDDLPFAEMVSKVPAVYEEVDVFLVTSGGSATQVHQFVSHLRPRFDRVEFLLPSMCMSAGTIWAMSGNEIWMDKRAYIGPIDPQVQNKSGGLVPAQALWTLLEELQVRGQRALSQKQPVSWTDVELLRSIDLRDLGNVRNATEYSKQLVASYLEQHKFRDWLVHSTSGQNVTPQERQSRALEIATTLANHSQWKTHGHGISREVAWNIVKLKINKPETVPGLERGMRRLWALMHWIFDNSPVAKIIISRDYSLFKFPQTTR